MELSQFASTESLTEKKILKKEHLRHFFYYNCPSISDPAISEYTQEHISSPCAKKNKQDLGGSQGRLFAC